MSELETLLCWTSTLVAFLQTLFVGLLSLADPVSTPQFDIQSPWKRLSVPQLCLHLQRK